MTPKGAQIITNSDRTALECSLFTSVALRNESLVEAYNETGFSLFGAQEGSNAEVVYRL